MAPILETTPAGCALAAAIVVAGAPLFSAGLRSLRLRSQLRHLAERPLAEDPTGLVLVRGRVALESPLVGPLSGKPCAGFRLEVRGASSAVMAAIEARRPFRLVGQGATARVLGAEGAVWDLSPTAERTVAPGERLSENLTALLESSPEAAWLSRRGAPLTLVERSLLSGRECFVVGSARHARPYELAPQAELVRTGTDPEPLVVAGSRLWGREPDLWIEADGHLEYLRISDRVPEPGTLGVTSWRTLGLAIGPLLSLVGLLYLANAAERLRAAGF